MHTASNRHGRLNAQPIAHSCNHQHNCRYYVRKETIEIRICGQSARPDGLVAEIKARYEQQFDQDAETARLLRGLRAAGLLTARSRVAGRRPSTWQPPSRRAPSWRTSSPRRMSGMSEPRWSGFRALELRRPVRACVTIAFCGRRGRQSLIFVPARVKGRPHPNPLPPGEGICHTPSKSVFAKPDRSS